MAETRDKLNFVERICWVAEGVVDAGCAFAVYAANIDHILEDFGRYVARRVEERRAGYRGGKVAEKTS